MHIRKHGYVAGAILSAPFARKLRDHVEYEKFLCRILVDNDKTQKFKDNTNKLKNKIYAFRYNGEGVEGLTAAGRNKDAN